MEDRSTGLVPSRARTCEHKVDTPHQPPFPTPTLAFQALIFHMISLPPVLRLALALRAAHVTAPFSTGRIFSETCFITVGLMERRSWKLRRNLWNLCFVKSNVQSYVGKVKTLKSNDWFCFSHWLCLFAHYLYRSHRFIDLQVKHRRLPKSKDWRKDSAAHWWSQ